jgi:hypothetical protein
MLGVKYRTSRGVQLSKAEREVFRKASNLAAQVRQRCQQIGGADFELSDLDMTLAHVEHDGGDLASWEFLVVDDRWHSDG